MENRVTCKYCNKKFCPFKIDCHQEVCRKVRWGLGFFGEFFGNFFGFFGGFFMVGFFEMFFGGFFVVEFLTFFWGF